MFSCNVRKRREVMMTLVCLQVAETEAAAAPTEAVPATDAAGKEEPKVTCTCSLTVSLSRIVSCDRLRLFLMRMPRLNAISNAASRVSF